MGPPVQGIVAATLAICNGGQGARGCDQSSLRGFVLDITECVANGVGEVRGAADEVPDARRP